MFSQVTWFFRLVHVENSPKRLFALEVMGKLLAENEREKPNESMMGEHDYGFGNNSQCVVNPETGTFSQGLLYRLTEHLLDFLFLNSNWGREKGLPNYTLGVYFLDDDIL